MRMTIPVAFAVLALAATARGEFVTLGVPATYTPGQAFTVEVGLAPVSGLGWYGVGVVFSAPEPLADRIQLAPPTPAASGYVFPTAEYFYPLDGPAGSTYAVLLSDFTFDPAGVDVTGGMNDRVVSLVVLTPPDLNTPITVSVDPDLTFLQLADGTDLAVSGLPSGTVLPSVAPPASVPAPPAVIVLAVGVVGVAAWKRRRAVRPA